MSNIADLLTPIDPGEVPAKAGGQRARTSQPVLDAFMDSGQVAAVIKTESLEGETTEDRTKRAKSLLSSLSLYAYNHEYPVQVFSRSGSDVYLRRLDLNDEGEEQAWTPPERRPRVKKSDSNGDTVEATEATEATEAADAVEEVTADVEE